MTYYNAFLKDNTGRAGRYFDVTLVDVGDVYNSKVIESVTVHFPSGRHKEYKGADADFVWNYISESELEELAFYE